MCTCIEIRCIVYGPYGQHTCTIVCVVHVCIVYGPYGQHTCTIVCVVHVCIVYGPYGQHTRTTVCVVHVLQLNLMILVVPYVLDIIKIYKTRIRMKLWCVFVCQVWSFRGRMLRSRCSSGAHRDRRRFPAVEHPISIGVWV